MNKSWKTKAIAFLYYTLFFLVPFIVLPVTSELFEFNKMLFIYAISALIFCLWLLDSLTQGTFLWKKTAFDIPIILFFLSQVLSTVFSIDPFTSFFGYYGRFNGGLLSLIVYIYLYYMFVLYVLPQVKAVRNLFYLTALSSFLVVLWGVPGIINHDLSCLVFAGKFDNSCWTDQFKPAERMFSTMGQPNWLGAYLSISFFVTVYLFITSKKKWSWYLIAAIFFQWIGLLYTRSRSSLFSLVPGGLMIVGFLFFNHEAWTSFFKEKKVQFFTILVFGIVSLVYIHTGIPQIDNVITLRIITEHRMQQTTKPVVTAQPALLTQYDVTESFDIRKIVWSGAWKLAAEYPLFGTGLETFGYAYYQVRPASHNLTSEWDYLYNRAHNEFLNVLATSGWIGFGAYMLLIGWITAILIKQCVGQKKDAHKVLLALTLLALILSISITNFFGFSVTVINLYWYLIPALALLGLESKPTAYDSHKKTTLFHWGIPLLIAILCANYLVSYWYADYLYAQSDGAINSGNVDVGVYLLTKALNLRYEHVYEDKLSYAMAQLAFIDAYKKQTNDAQNYMNKSEQYNLDSIKASPQNVLYWKTRIKNQYVYYQMTLDTKFLFTGLSALDEAIKLAPTDPKIPYFASTYYTLLYDEEKDPKLKLSYETKSLDAINQAITLKINYQDAYILKMQLLKKYKRLAELKALDGWYLVHVDPTNPSIQKEYAQLSGSSN